MIQQIEFLSLPSDYYFGAFSLTLGQNLLRILANLGEFFWGFMEVIY